MCSPQFEEKGWEGGGEELKDCVCLRACVCVRSNDLNASPSTLGLQKIVYEAKLG